MKKLTLIFAVLFAMSIAVGCQEEPEPTPEVPEVTPDEPEDEPEEETKEPDGDALVAYNATSEALALYEYLQNTAGESIISGSMANVNWNINEAEWVNQHIGSYPAMAGFDYIHLYGTWIDYTDISVLEDWWDNNGLITICWHWNVPITGGSSSYAFYTEQTLFDISNITDELSWEYRVLEEDIEKAADRLLVLKDAGIPVIWRPLHEASGGWFWWGAKGAEPFKALWKMMFEVFEEKEVNNVIWCWTTEVDDDDWYPGDEYVDIIGRDKYSVWASSLADNYTTLSEKYPGKLLTLSEFGSINNDVLILDQQWSWFMPWYDYSRTLNPGSETFESRDHTYATADFWDSARANERVLFREDMPSLK